MATFKKSAIISEISGTISGNTFLSAGTNSSIRARSNRSGNRTASQSRYRNSFAAVASAWRNLAPASRLLWSSQAPEELSGYGYFCRQNTRILWAGGSIADNPNNPAPSINPVFTGARFSNLLQECFINFNFSSSTVLPIGWGLCVRLAVTSLTQARPTQADKYKLVYVYAPGDDLNTINIFDSIGAAIGTVSNSSLLHFQFSFVSLVNGNLLPLVYEDLPAFIPDPDAAAFIAAVGITDPDEITAIDNCFIQLKLNGFYSVNWNMAGYTSIYVLNCLYPYLGIDNSKAAFNMCNPDNTDAAFRLTFGGTPTLLPAGMQYNGSNSFADTHFRFDLNYSLNDGCIFFIAANNIDSTGYDMGALSVSLGFVRTLIRSRFANDFYYGFNASSSGVLSPNLDASGFNAVSRIGPASLVIRNNGSNKAVAQASSADPELSIYLGALNVEGSATEFSPRTYGMHGIGQGMDGPTLALLESILLGFMTALGR